ncbi:MAG TPA: DUF1552 domain-containing protein [Polyangia bacterium]|nr:DUF1552 domain-containing protein [Polyangia bacterium]
MSRFTRRQLLRGAGGFSLALPFLPSLVDRREARAATAAAATKKRFVQMATQHGGIWGSNMYPAATTLTDTMTYAGRTISRGALALQTSAGTAQLSPVLRGPSTLLTAKLAAKMNVLRGCDIPFYIGHHTGGHLGNYARNDGNGQDGVAMQAYPTPTIDQLMAWSTKFYPDLATIKQRSLVIGPRLSYNWTNPATPSNLGLIQEVAGSFDAPALFSEIFVKGGGATDPNALTKPIVDRVNADYLRLRNGNTRLSSDDRRRLDDHMQRLSELQRRLSVRVSCPDLSPVVTDTQADLDMGNFGLSPPLQTEYYQAMNDVIVAAFLCDTSRIATMNIREDFSTYAGDWHADVAHHSGEPDGAMQAVITAAHQLTFEKVFLDLCSKLDVDDGTGQSVLDGALVAWTQESGEYTHAGQGMPIVTAGGAGGWLKTGSYCDYRNPAFVSDNGEQGNTIVKITGGLLWQQWLGTALQAMNLAPADYEANGLGGYPGAIKFIGSGMAKFYPDAVWTVAGEPLPFLKA